MGFQQDSEPTVARNYPFLPLSPKARPAKWELKGSPTCAQTSKFRKAPSSSPIAMEFLGSYHICFNAEPLEWIYQSFYFLDLGEMKWEKEVLPIALIRTIISKPMVEGDPGLITVFWDRQSLAKFPMSIKHSWLSEAESVT